MLSGIEKNKKISESELPIGKTAATFRPKPRGFVVNKSNPEIVDVKWIVKKNTTFDNLDAKILLLIFSHFNEKELSSHVRGVCRRWYEVARDPKLWKELEFEGERTDGTTICDFLRNSKKLEKLSLKDMVNPLTAIRQMCRCNHWLKHVKIKNCRNGQSEKIPESVLRNILHSCRYLESLDLNGTQFSATRFYHELANLPRLRKLNLSNSKHILAKDLVAIALNCRNLEDISITKAQNSTNLFQITDQDVVFFFKNLSHSLKRVDFDTTGLTCPSFEAILGCPNLERLSLRHALFLSGEIFRTYVSRLRGLKQLRLTQARQLVSDDFLSLSQDRVFDRLDLLDLSGCGRISDIGLKSLLQRCKDGLTHLNLKSCKSVRDLYFVMNNCTRLQYLNIAHSVHQDPSYLEHLTSRIPKLKKLVIDNETLSRDQLIALHIRAPELKLIRSMSEFHEDESPVSFKEDGY